MAAALLAAGCGSTSNSTSSSMSPTEKWADGVCSAVTTYTDSLKAVGATLQTGNLTVDSVDAARKSAQGATDTLKSTLQGLGKPPVQASDTTQHAVAQLSSQLKAGVASMQSAVAGSPPLAAVSVVANSLANMKTQIKTFFTTVKAEGSESELVTAFQQTPSCRSIQGT